MDLCHQKSYLKVRWSSQRISYCQRLGNKKKTEEFSGGGGGGHSTSTEEMDVVCLLLAGIEVCEGILLTELDCIEVELEAGRLEEWHSGSLYDPPIFIP